MAGQDTSNKKLFIRGLPSGTTNGDLEDVFTEYGPVKSCFTVKEKGSEECKGYGYVIYCTKEDAETAQKSVKYIKSKKVSLQFAAKRKGNDKQTEASRNDLDEDREETNTAKLSTPNYPIVSKSELQASEQGRGKRKSKSKRAAASKPVGRTLIVSGFPGDVSKKIVQKVCKKFGCVETLEFPVHGLDDSSEGVSVSVQYKSYETAKRALKGLNGKSFKGVKLRAKKVSQLKREPSQKALKKSRLIIRNLSFKAKEEDIRNALKEFGQVIEVNIPSKNGRVRGFAFVQFTNVFDASNALSKVNGTAIKDRVVAVDWVVPKSVFENAKQPLKEDDLMDISDEDVNTSHMDNHEDEPPDDDDNDNHVEASVEDEDLDENESIDEEFSDECSPHLEEKGETSYTIEESGDKLMEFDVNDYQDEEDGTFEEADTACDNSDDRGSDDETGSDEDETGSDEDETGSDEDEIGSDNEGKEEKEEVPEAKRKRVNSNDAKEGKTIFIRNLPFDCDEVDLEELFSQFGDIVYCKIVVNKDTGLPRGSAFVKFSEMEAVEKCIAVADTTATPNKGLVLDGRQLSVTMAITREEASTLKKSGVQKDVVRDKRNLYLAKEGQILPGTEAAEPLSKSDISKRMKAMQEKKAKLSNPNFFISKTRLSVRNIPTNIDDKKLKSVFLEGCGIRTARIKQVKILRSTEKVSSEGIGRSKGCGFVEFDTHEAALAALRATNNNPNTFGPEKRPIVEFAIENARALQLRRDRQQRQFTRKTGTSSKDGSKVIGKNKSPSFKKQFPRGAKTQLSNKRSKGKIKKSKKHRTNKIKSN